MNIEQIKDRKERARKLINSLNYGITEWKLTDADNVDDQPDMVMAAALRDVDTLLERVAELEKLDRWQGESLASFRLTVDGESNCTAIDRITEAIQERDDLRDRYTGSSACGHLRHLISGYGTIAESCNACEVASLTQRAEAAEAKARSYELSIACIQERAAVFAKPRSGSRPRKSAVEACSWIKGECDGLLNGDLRIAETEKAK